MSALEIIGALVITAAVLFYLLSILDLFVLSDYGPWETLKTNWNRSGAKLWVEILIIASLCSVWWWLVGSHIHFD